MVSLQSLHFQYMIVVVFGFSGIVTAATTIRSACDGLLNVISSESGWITSPGYDGTTKYQKNLLCSWNFRAPLGMVYHFKFTAFDLESSTPCPYDSLRIEEYVMKNNMPQSSTELAKLCHFGYLPGDITAKRRDVDFIFKTDDQVEKLGFNVTYTLISYIQCGNHQWKCAGANQCIAKSLMCNGVNNCPDGSDEVICPNKPGCGVSAIPQRLINPKIVGGNAAVQGSWPWSASLLDEYGTNKCGVTIVHPMWAITAAHCFPIGLRGHSVAAGRYKRNETDRNEQRIYVEEFIKLKTFDTLSGKDDIAMVRLKKPFKLNDYVKTVCWPSKRIENGEYGWIVGWGHTVNPKGLDDPFCCDTRQQQARLPIIGSRECRGPSYNLGARILRSMMCAGIPSGTVDACFGDSGGSFVRQRAIDKRWEIQGIISWGDKCGDAKLPGVYTVVYDYLNWIRDVVTDKKYNYN